MIAVTSSYTTVAGSWGWTAWAGGAGRWVASEERACAAGLGTNVAFGEHARPANEQMAIH